MERDASRYSARPGKPWDSEAGKASGTPASQSLPWLLHWGAAADWRTPVPHAWILHVSPVGRLRAFSWR